MELKDIEKTIAQIKDFPKQGIIFRDITPLFLEPEKIKFIIDEMVKKISVDKIDVVVAPESRGYLFGLPLALTINKPFVMVRKPNKLPREKLSINYELEYGNNTLEIHKNDIKENSNVLIVDDLIATGGTTCAIQDLIEQMNANVVEQVYLIELLDLVDRTKLKGNVISLIKY